MGWDRKDIFGIEGLTKEELFTILKLSKYYQDSMKSKPAKSFTLLQGYTIVNMFFEASTRTRVSFEVAEKRMGAFTINFDVEMSSVKKGETFVDTIKTINAMQVDAIVIRHSDCGIPQLTKKYFSGSVLNAGDGTHEHPTQTLLDLLSMWEHIKCFEDIHVGIVGDILYSRVARSLIIGLKTLGTKVSLIGPPTLLPEYFKDWGVNIYYKLDDIISELDIIYIYRIQKERAELLRPAIPSIGDFAKLYQVNEPRIEKAKKDVLIMHPGPAIRDSEVSTAIYDSKRCLALDQVTSGVAVRMALLQLLLKGEINNA
ncbi:MAG: aspartate carbamoyltransferase catalytic subunit [Actinobacteria bacterium]|nr:aspartate carbamoyltransferase catalytic subunit [Actinomycetota bacterium]